MAVGAAVGHAHTAFVHLSTRVEDDRRVRVVEWSENTTSDLGVLLLLAVLTFAFGGFVAAAVETAGWVRAVFVVLGVVAGLYWAMIAIPLGLFALGVYVVKGFLAKTPTRAQQAAFAVPAVAIGALLGLGPYESGPAALLAGPVVAAVVISVVWGRTSSRRARTRWATLSCIGAAVSIAVGCTIFL